MILLKITTRRQGKAQALSFLSLPAVQYIILSIGLLRLTIQGSIILVPSEAVLCNSIFHGRRVLRNTLSSIRGPLKIRIRDDIKDSPVLFNAEARYQRPYLNRESKSETPLLITSAALPNPSFTSSHFSSEASLSLSYFSWRLAFCDLSKASFSSYSAFTL